MKRLIVAATTALLIAASTPNTTQAKTPPVYKISAPAIVYYRIGNGTVFFCAALNRNALYCEHGGRKGNILQTTMWANMVRTENAISGTVALTMLFEAIITNLAYPGTAAVDSNGAFTCPSTPHP